MTAAHLLTRAVLPAPLAPSTSTLASLASPQTPLSGLTEHLHARVKQDDREKIVGYGQVHFAWFQSSLRAWTKNQNKVFGITIMRL